ncbi:hypothetical protein HPB51_016833 [Rhipicephalus microplus]|uniref:Uncharacterized protein n=1 Tax=Rhipicephalus microplus TaxID=6941 RepID=A0A9J6EIB2_RHIMP|nr:hypothetical protein HPB51_016833 [Rhipicephalus microplus]
MLSRSGWTHPSKKQRRIFRSPKPPPHSAGPSRGASAPSRDTMVSLNSRCVRGTEWRRHRARLEDVTGSGTQQTPPPPKDSIRGWPLSGHLKRRDDMCKHSASLGLSTRITITLFQGYTTQAHTLLVGVPERQRPPDAKTAIILTHDCPLFLSFFFFCGGQPLEKNLNAVTSAAIETHQ